MRVYAIELVGSTLNPNFLCNPCGCIETSSFLWSTGKQFSTCLCYNLSKHFPDYLRTQLLLSYQGTIWNFVNWAHFDYKDGLWRKCILANNLSISRKTFTFFSHKDNVSQWWNMSDLDVQSHFSSQLWSSACTRFWLVAQPRSFYWRRPTICRWLMAL